MSLLLEAETWVAVSFLIFVGILVYAGVPQLLINALDKRANRVQADLDEARRLKEEAQKLLAEYQGKQRQAEGEIKMEEFVARRTKMAETKIAQAEAQAVADVRAAAAEAAVAAAERILTVSVKGKVADDLIARGIGDVKAKLN